jgi:acid phosphatase (class A)
VTAPCSRPTPRAPRQALALRRAARGLLAGLALLALGSAALADAPACPPLAAPTQTARDPIVHAIELIGPPPTPDSAGGGADFAASHAAFSADRVALASRDDCLDAFVAFASAMPAGFERATRPRTAALLRTFTDALYFVTDEAKKNWSRKRPFMLDPTVARCTGVNFERLRTNGAYPSGHAALGWGIALLLAEVAPERAQAVLERGREFGDSRVVCGVHWPSDVEAGRVLAASVVARLHGERDFRKLLDAARSELAKP